MKYFYFYSALVVFILTGITLSAQQYPLFSNYMLNTYAFNPAIPGEAGVVDIRGVYRTQWVQFDKAPETQVAILRGRLKNVPVTMGGLMYNDSYGALRRTGIAGNLGYYQKLGEKSGISVGAMVGGYNYRVSNDIIITDDTDLSIANGQDGVWVPDYSAGVYFHTGNLYTGISTPQIFQNNVNFFNEGTEVETELVRHYYWLVGYNIPITEKISVEPSALIKYVSPAPFQFDAGVRINLGSSFWFGGTYRHLDATAGLIGFSVANIFDVAYAYDFTTSEINQASNGSHEITLGLKLGRKKDTDGDGIPDKEDKCPEVPGLPEFFGCPDDGNRLAEDELQPDGDFDKDKVLNKDDLCPKVYGDITNNGCPFGDRDIDGVRDDLDKCPDLAGLVSNDGCPINDRDRDGVVDTSDKCPDEPGPVHLSGCPTNEKDTDGDGIADAIDKCPTIPGSVNAEGCPNISKDELDILNIAIANLYFDTDKADIQEESMSSLDRLGRLLKRRDDLAVRMAGFADYRGSAEYNLELSKKRAIAVYNYLYRSGVPRDQLKLEYYGEEPADGKTVSNLRRDRRVEMEFFYVPR